MKRKNIIIVENKDRFGYESIQNLLHSAHESNKTKGLVYGVADQSAEKLKVVLNSDAVCFVALDGNKLIGTGTIEFRKKLIFNKVFNIACFGLFGVLEEYKGFNIGGKILDKCIKTAEMKGVRYIYCSTSADNNMIVRKMYIKRGFIKFDFFKAKVNNFYSVRYLKCPYQSGLIELLFNFIYYARKFYVILKQQFKGEI